MKRPNQIIVPPSVQIPPQVMVLTITLKVDGPSIEINVDGPIQDRVLCYGMLEAAKDTIRDWVPPKPDTTPPSPDLSKVLKNHGITVQ